MNSEPPVEVDNAKGAGANGEEGAACPNPLDCAPKPVEGSPLLDPAGEAGWEKENAALGAGSVDELKAKGDGLLKVEGLPGAEAGAPDANGFGAAAGAPPKEKGGAAVVGVGAPPNENPLLLGRGASLPVDVEGPNENGAAGAAGADVAGVTVKLKGLLSSVVLGDENGFEGADAPKPPNEGAVVALEGADPPKRVEVAFEFPNEKLSVGLGGPPGWISRVGLSSILNS